MEKKIVKRKKGQRRMKSMLPFITFGRSDGKLVLGTMHSPERTVVGTYKKTGTFILTDEFGSVKAQSLLVTLKDGTLVPAYRRSSKHCVCQDFGYLVK